MVLRAELPEEDTPDHADGDSEFEPLPPGIHQAQEKAQDGQEAKLAMPVARRQAA